MFGLVRKDGEDFEDDLRAPSIAAQAAQYGLEANLLRGGIATLCPVLGTPGQVILAGRAGHITDLTRPELFQVVRRRHAPRVEEVFVLPDALRSGLCVLALRCDVVD
jgi:hypothetical protein